MSRIPTLGPRGEGWVVLQSILLVAIPFASWEAALDPAAETPPLALGRDVGAVVLIGGLALVALSIALLRASEALSVLPRPLESGALVAIGPYRIIRHPIYSGLILVGLGLALLRASPLVGLLTVALAVVLDLKRRREEAWLRERYPDYASYQARTRALVPFVY